MLEKARQALRSIGINPENIASLRLINKDKKYKKGSIQKVRYLLRYHDEGPQGLLCQKVEDAQHYDVVYQRLKKLKLVD